MSFSSAREFLEISLWAMARRYGITIKDMEIKAECSRRTAQRKLVELTELLPGYRVDTNSEGEKVWIFNSAQLGYFVNITSEQLSALNLAEKTLRDRAATKEAEALKKLSEIIHAAIPSNKSFALEGDSSALLQAQGVLTRPGPKTIVDNGIFEAIGRAIKGGSFLTFKYKSGTSIRQRTIAPYGVVYGTRPYLVGHSKETSVDDLRYFRVDKISEPRIESHLFDRDESFDLSEYTNRSFGVFQKEEEYEEIIWKFSPRASKHAESFQFHPDQAQEYLDDGSLIVRFKASGYLEMCWYLYSWGSDVEVVAPQKLREMCEPHQSLNFAALP